VILPAQFKHGLIISDLACDYFASDAHFPGDDIER
jgi:hypothetical protein